MFCGQINLGCVTLVKKSFSLLDRDGEEKQSGWRMGVIPTVPNPVGVGGGCTFMCGRILLLSLIVLSFTDQTTKGCGQPRGPPEFSCLLCDSQIRRQGNCSSTQRFLWITKLPHTSLYQGSDNPSSGSLSAWNACLKCKYIASEG